MKPRIQWGRLLRRSLALFLATLAVWALLCLLYTSELPTT